MNSANKVGEIFAIAGAAFNQLGELTTHLHQSSQSLVSKWTQEEIEMLQEVVANFAEGLHKLSEHIRLRTVVQIRNALRKRAFEEAGLPVPYVPPTIHIQHQAAVVIPTLGGPRRKPLPSPSAESESEENAISKEEMTLNMLNAPDSDEDEVYNNSRLKFDSNSEEDNCL